VSEKGLSAAIGVPRRRGNAVEAPRAVSSAATGGTREPGPLSPSERRAGERIGAACATLLQRGVPGLP
jgi:hypothetical protein